MNWIENLLIIAGISLDIFAAMECHGSMVAKIEKKKLVYLSLFLSLWQLAVLFIGHFLSNLLIQKDGIAENERFIGNVIAAVIFIGLGVRLLAKAIKNESIQEHREDTITFTKFFCMLSATGAYTLLAGIAFGFVRTNPVILLVMTIGCSMFAVTAGIYTGYHFGFEQKRKAYGAGAILLFAAGVDIVIRYL